ncbi:MAG: hypothetical protein EAZ61_11460 [Oscillatoriales cyanobacterium]|nr:MAG: hypothetical protein EAZ61_11460 [Oscillatoriales cyanobacterium]
MSATINERVDALPNSGMTIFALKALDFVIPGEWNNLTGWENTIRTVTGEEDASVIQMVSDRAIDLYNDSSQGYQNALWLYDTIDSAGSALGTAALANKVGEKVPLLGLLNKLTPRPDKAQAIDLSLKLIVEIIAFCKINGIPGDSVGDFMTSLREYGSESLMRMVALVCFDGLIPLGPDFIGLVTDKLAALTEKDLTDNSGFKQIKRFIPDRGAGGQLGFIQTSFGTVSDWMGNFVTAHDLTPQKVISSLQSFIEVSDDKLDYVAAFLDMSTNYYAHTGVQTLAKRLIDRAYAEI